MLVSEIISRARFYLWWVTTYQITDSDLLEFVKTSYKEAKIVAIQNSWTWSANWEEAEANIVSWQRKYWLPSDLISLKRIEINLTWSDDGWQVVFIDDIRDLDASENAWYNPTLCTIFDSYFTLNSAPTANVTSWIKIIYSDESPTLTTSTDIAVNSVVSLYIIYSVCLAYSISRTLDTQMKKFQDLFDRYEKKVWKFYSNRLPAVRSQIRGRQVNYN